MTDTQLFEQYLAQPSEQAFTLLVQRHIDLVYSVALRQLRDPHMAEDVTQAVFIVLARRAHTLKNRASTLPGWLVQTTRYSASAAQKLQRRRTKYEREAAAMAPVSYTPPSESPDITPLLNDGLANLNPADRTAIILRYLQAKSVQQVSEELGISEPAATKRISRALGRVRKYFTRQGVQTASQAIESAYSSQFLQAAPPALLPSIVSHSMAASAGAATSALTQATLKSLAWAHTKFLASACAASIFVVAGTTTLVVKSPLFARADVPRTTAPATVAITLEPMKFANAIFMPSGPDNEFIMDTDSTVTRTTAPAGLIQSTTPRASQAHRTFTPAVAFLRGRRIRFSGWMKTENVPDTAGLFINVYGQDKRVLAHDGMFNRPAHGTTDWQQYQIVTDIPPQTTDVMIGHFLRGTGKVWSDDLQIEIVSNTTPLTDDSTWHTLASHPDRYSTSSDPSTQHDGRPATRIAPAVSAVPFDYATYERLETNIEKYRGKRVNFTAWIKSNTPNAIAKTYVGFMGPDFHNLLTESRARTLTLTTDWQQYEIGADVPPDAFGITVSASIFGKSTFWLDDVKMTAVDPSTPAPTTRPTPIEIITLSNDSFLSLDNPLNFTADIDPSMQHSGHPALVFGSTTAKPTDSGAGYHNIDPTPFLGKRVRYSAWVKSEKLANWGGLNFVSWDKNGHVLSVDPMPDRPIAGTTDWKKLEIVSDVSPETAGVNLVVHLRGKGKLWLDDARIEVVPLTVPTTDDHNWHLFAPFASMYKVTKDQTVQHDNHPSTCITAAPPAGSWCWYGLSNHSPDKFRGKRIRISGWMKTENVVGSGARLSCWCTGADGKNVCIDDPATRQLVKGTTPWTHYEITADVPQDVDHVDPGLNLFGKGKVWFEGLHYELFDEPDSNL